MATPGSILVASGTRNLVEGYFKFHPLGPQTVKGLDAPAMVFELVGANPVRSRLQASAAGGLTSFVGRDAELDVLSTRAAAASMSARRGSKAAAD